METESTAGYLKSFSKIAWVKSFYMLCEKRRVLSPPQCWMGWPTSERVRSGMPGESGPRTSCLTGGGASQDASVCALIVQSCLTLLTPPGSTVNGTFQARILEWIAIPYTTRSSQFRDWTQVSRVSCIVRHGPFIPEPPEVGSQQSLSLVTGRQTTASPSKAELH